MSRNLLETECRFLWSTYRKSYSGSQMVTSPMISRDFEKSKWWLWNIWFLISRNPRKSGLFTFGFWALSDLFGVTYAHMPTNWSPWLTELNILRSNGTDTAFHRTYSCVWYMLHFKILTLKAFQKLKWPTMITQYYQQQHQWMMNDFLSQ